MPMGMTVTHVIDSPDASSCRKYAMQLAAEERAELTRLVTLGHRSLRCRRRLFATCRDSTRR
jgi:hypothetical protein